MENLKRRGLSLLLALVMIVSLFAGIQLPQASAATYVYNWGTRGTTATFLSPMAEQWYEDNNTSYQALSAYTGASSTDDAPDSALYGQLQTLMTNAHDHQTSYDETKNLYQYTDCENSGGTISSFYSGTAIGPSWETGGWNREHTWPQSKGLEGKDEDDIMMLRPTATSENGSRSNMAYGASTGYYNPNSVSNGIYDLRGDVSRIFLYVYVRWGITDGNGEYDSDGNPYTTWGLNGVIESKEVLLAWMEADPVDTWEMGRNDAVESITGTRNVFVDYPELAFLLFDAEIPADYDSPSGEAASSAFTLTATSNNTNYGTVSVSGRNINAIPAEGYVAVGYTVTSGTATVTQDGNVFSVNASGDCTVQINFAAKTAATVKFQENGATTKTQNTYLGDEITLPAPTATPTGFHFVGWVESIIDDTEVKPTTFYAEGDTYTVASTTLHALYSYVESSGGGTGMWTLVTDASKLSAGAEVVIAYNPASYVATDLGSNTYMGYASASFFTDNNTITELPDTAMILTLGGNANAWTLANPDGELLGSSSTELYWDGGTTTWTINIDSGNATIAITSNASEALQYNKSSPRFKTYTSSQQLPQIYMMDGTAGTTYYTTSTCDHTDTTTTTVDATCTADGSTTVTCDDCGTVISETTIPATGHNYVDGTCTVCGNSEPAESVQVVIYAPEYMMALSSTYSTESTNYNAGVEVTVSGSSVTGYDSTEVWTLTDNGDGTYSILYGDQYLCLSDSYTSMALCDPADDTVTHHHNWEIIPVGENLYNIRNTTRTLDGNTGYCIEWYAGNNYYCAYKTDTPYSNKNYQLSFHVVSGTLPTFTCDHAYVVTSTPGPSCTAYDEVKVCSKCGDKQTTEIPATTDHNMVAGTVVPPTATDYGYTLYHCDICGSYTEERDKVDPITGTEGITVTFVVPAGVAPIKSQTTDSTGIELPTPGIPSADYEYTFAGWATSIVDNSTTAPTLYTGNYAPTADITLYAVYTYAPVDNVFTLVESTEDLVIGNEFVITANDLAEYPYGMGAQKSSNRGADSVTVISDTTITIGENVQVFVLDNGTVANTYAFKSDDGYLYAASSSSNQLKTQSSNNGNSSWAITIDATTHAASVVATASSNRNVMQFNYNGGSPLFACYSSASQKALSLYTKSATVLTYTTEITRTEAYNVTFSTPSGVAAIPSTVCGKTGIILPTAGTPYNEYGYAFMGWTTTALDKETTKPTIYTAGSPYYATDDITFYAVYSYSTEGDGSVIYKLATDVSDLADGKNIVIVAADYDYALSTTQNNNNRGQASVTKVTTNKTVTFGDDVQILTLGAVTDAANIYTLSTGSGYLYAASSSSNHLKTNAAVQTNGNSNFLFAFSDNTCTIVAQGTAGRNTLKYNNSSSLFSCYSPTSTQAAVSVYVETPSGATTYYTTAPIVATPPELKFYSASLEVGEGISINYKVAASLFAENLYDLDSACATFVFNKESEDERTFTVSNPVLSGDYYVFQLKNIRPDWMGDVVTATLTATDANGESITSKAIEYSVKDYCYNKLENETAETSFSTLLVDMLNYGAATQLHTGYKTDALVNADLTDTQKGWGSDTTKTLTNVQGLSGEAGSVSWKGAALFLRETTRIRLRFAAEDVTGLTVVATVGGNSYELTNFISAGNGQYYVFFDNLLATQMRDNVEFTVMDGDSAVSKTLTYSVASYAAAVSESNTTLYNMIHAMMRYGDSVDVYAG